MSQETFPFLVSSPKKFEAHLTLNFHEDPGHGWLEVPMEVLEQFGLDEYDFSHYSYRRGDVLFLEEDCDAPKFVKMANQYAYEIRFSDVSYDDECFIRNLPSIY